jgi:hypothetical protein
MFPKEQVCEEDVSAVNTSEWHSVCGHVSNSESAHFGTENFGRAIENSVRWLLQCFKWSRTGCYWWTLRHWRLVVLKFLLDVIAQMVSQCCTEQYLASVNFIWHVRELISLAALFENYWPDFQRILILWTSLTLFIRFLFRMIYINKRHVHVSLHLARNPERTTFRTKWNKHFVP